MAVLGRVLITSGERLDLPDILSIDSYAAGDWKFFLKGLIGDSKPLILKGFDVIDPDTAIGAQGCAIRVADSVVFYPGSNAGSFYHGLPEGDPNAASLVPELRKNAVNYVYLTFSTLNTSVDTRAIWDPDKDGGDGGEFTQDINTESALQVSVNVSTGSFPANTIPVAKITVGPVVITKIEDARDMMFRLGAGGISPNPLNTYSWRSLPNSSYQRTEPPTAMSAGGINPFQGADKNILSMKEWMDAVMTKLAELGGTTYWYEDASTYNLISSWVDTSATAFKSKGSWTHSTVTPGLISWSDDINIKITKDPRTYIIRNGSKLLNDEQVMYIAMERNLPLNPNDDVVSWTNAQNYVNTVGGALGLFANLAKGDYIKKVNDSADKYLRVEEFYDAVNLGGSTTTAANARSIRLSGTYQGTTLEERGRYDKGEYLASDVTVSNRDQVALSNLGGNFHWLAMRSDTILNIASAVTTDLTVSITLHDGTKAKVTSSGAHGLVDGDYVTIRGSTNFNGTYKVEVETSTIFYIQKSGGPFSNETGRNAAYATITTASRSTLYGFQLESANHGFNTDDYVIVDGTTNYNANIPVSVRDSTTFTIPVGGNYASESTGTATLARSIVRTEGSVTRVVQGESVSIGGNAFDNMMSYTGMTSLAESSPDYSIPTSYEAMYGSENYNSTAGENLTARIAKLTAMMGNKAQDKTVKFLSENLTSIQNTTSGANQELTFLASGATLTIIQPGNPNGNAVITLPDTSPGISLPVYSAAYTSIDRNNSSTPSISVTDISSVPVGENIFIIAVRLGTTDCWLWDGMPLSTGSNPVPLLEGAQDRNLKLVKGGTWSWNSGTGTLAWSSDAYLQVIGLTEVSNTISAGSSILSNDGDCLYVTINRTTIGTFILSTVVANISSVPVSANNVIIARRVGTAIIVGNNSMLLINGESKELYSGLSVQNRALIGTSVTEATSDPSYSSRGAVNRITSNSEGALDAIARHDAEVDKFFGQLRMIAKTAGTTTRARITGSDRVMFTGETLGQQISSLRMYFTGAEIDFATGNIYGGDATLPLSTDFSTPLGTNFTPASISANQYLWYSIAANPSTANVDGTLNIQFNVVAGTQGSTLALATKPALAGAVKLGYIGVQENGTATSILALQQVDIVQLGMGSGSGSGGGIVKANLYDPVNTALTTGSPVVIDGVTVTDNMDVLFSNLISGNNEIYRATVSGGNVTAWQSQYVFNGFNTPTSGDFVVITEGNGFAYSVGEFKGTAWKFNDTVRYFNGTDYWELSALQTSTLNDNTTDNLIVVSYSGSENMLIDYSILRGINKETGTLFVTTNGTTVSVSNQSTYLGTLGVTFSGVINGTDLEVKYTTTSTGDSATMKYTVKRWSNAAGGPGGIPSYAPVVGSPASAGGPSGSIQYNAAGSLNGNSNFQLDTVDLSLNYNGMRQTALSSGITIVDNQLSPTLLFSYSLANSFAIIEYSVVKGGGYRVGRLLIANDGTITSISSDHVETAVTGVGFTSAVVGGNVEVYYTSTNTGSNGTFKYAARRWS